MERGEGEEVEEGAIFSLLGEGQEGRVGEAATNFVKWYTMAVEAATIFFKLYIMAREAATNVVKWYRMSGEATTKKFKWYRIWLWRLQQILLSGSR